MGQRYKLFTAAIYECKKPNEARVFLPGKSSVIFVRKAKHLKDSPLGKALDLLTTLRLG